MIEPNHISIGTATVEVFRLMSSTRKKRMAEAARKRQSRGRIYIIAIIAIVVIAIGIAWYVYSTSQSANSPSFVIAAPTGVTIHAGQPTTSTINVTATNNFDGTIRLSASPSTGLTATISPQNITGSGTATLTTSAAKNGTYTVTITGTSGGVSHSISPVVDTPVFATLQTTNGTIVVELFRAQAPETVNNFVNLANSHFYDNLVWHRIVPQNPGPAVIQTGDPNTRYGNTSRSTWGTGGSSQTVPLEIDPTLHNNLRYLGMARSNDPNSGSSQFYINMANNNYLDGQYTVFGMVLGSMAAANAIWSTQTYTSGPYNEQPISPVFLLSVTINP